MKALLFGSIGTISATSHLQWRAYNEAFASNDLDWHWSEAEYRELLMVPGGMNRLTHYRDRHAADVSDDTLKAVHDDKRTHYHAMLERGEASLRPGVERILEAADVAGVRVGFVTTTDRSNIERILASVGAEIDLDRFAVVIDRSRVEREKPDPEAYRIALGTLDCRPEEAVAIEDTAECLDAAVDAGIVCLAVPHGFSRGQDFSRAVATVDSLGDRTHAAEVLDGELVLESGMVTLGALDELRSRHAADAA